MCRLLGYIGPSIPLDYVLTKPEHSLVVQSYQPREMKSGVVNADGFGIGWYHPQKDTAPFVYKNILPIWNDVNLSSLGRYIESDCILGYIRSATTGQAVDMSNCQPFKSDRLLCIHNGRIENFKQTLMRPICDRLSDTAYKGIAGSTDSEHFFALFIDELQKNPSVTLEQALQTALLNLDELAKSHQISASANMIISNGKRLIASRFATSIEAPTLYWTKEDPTFPKSVIIASEPIFAGDWHSFPEQSILSVGEDLEIEIHQIATN
ncbi:ergothioneine biosynthesis protein EgtC [Aliterella atlantica]|uniref:Glutamine amidotransferase n=1 Tax=Aliterella atlantica CENA595 TaxID=1618023 RepID=A0A0D8ZVA1_9CYAN|nr:ergothioneine biosynthesis protein EgtC [Aliterella atlantica]KJH72307.1 glutamine amidotransferase [Aliterella atlantica CENA595]